ncbi:MAG: hypothetical protein AAB377_03110 [Patescibacteria group bacterium]
MEFSLPKRDFVNLTVYNTLGQVVETLVSSEMEAGAHRNVFFCIHKKWLFLGMKISHYCDYFIFLTFSCPKKNSCHFFISRIPLFCTNIKTLYFYLFIFGNF